MRYYGLLSPARRIRFKRLQLLLAERRRMPEQTKITTAAPVESPCPNCATGTPVMVRRLPRIARSPPRQILDYNQTATGAGA